MKKKKIKFGVANNGLEAVEMWKTGGFHLILVRLVSLFLASSLGLRCDDWN